MSARDEVLQRIGSALGRDAGASAGLLETPTAVIKRLAATHRHTQPALAGDLTERLIEQMESVQMTVVRLQTPEEIVAAVDWYRQSENIAGALTVAPALAHLDWPDGVSFGPATGQETTSVTPVMAAVAETGSVVMASGKETPATLNFLPENHIVVVNESQIVPYLEDVWSRLRDLAVLPRALNLVTGPSRTADIEQTIEIGAHGPRRMHVLLITSE